MKYTYAILYVVILMIMIVFISPAEGKLTKTWKHSALKTWKKSNIYTQKYYNLKTYKKTAKDATYKKTFF